MKKTIRILSLLCALLLLCPLAAVAEASDTENLAQLITENTNLDLSVYEGKAIYLNFFTEWCPYCMEEMPYIKQAFESYDPEQLQIVLVHVWADEDASNSESIRTKYGLKDMTFFEDEDMALTEGLGLQGFPMSLFLNKDGTVSDAMNYALDYDTIAAALDEMDVAKIEKK